MLHYATLRQQTIHTASAKIVGPQPIQHQIHRNRMSRNSIVPHFFTLYSLLCFTVIAAADPDLRQTREQLASGPGGKQKMDYLLYLPNGYHESKKDWPLILFLHGAGERGTHIDKVAKHGPPKIVRDGTMDLPFIIVSPQCPNGKWWSDQAQLKKLAALLDTIENKYRVDKQRVYLTGLSMGGYGTWHLAGARPERFAAIAPICGGGNPKDAKKLSALPMWVFHGARDSVVPLAESERMVRAVKAEEGETQFTIYPEAGHDSWSATYANPDLYDWFLQQQR